MWEAPPCVHGRLVMFPVSRLHWREVALPSTSISKALTSRGWQGGDSHAALGVSHLVLGSDIRFISGTHYDLSSTTTPISTTPLSQPPSVSTTPIAALNIQVSQGGAGP